MTWLSPLLHECTCVPTYLSTVSTDYFLCILLRLVSCLPPNVPTEHTTQQLCTMNAILQLFSPCEANCYAKLNQTKTCSHLYSQLLQFSSMHRFRIILHFPSPLTSNPFSPVSLLCGMTVVQYNELATATRNADATPF